MAAATLSTIEDKRSVESNGEYILIITGIVMGITFVVVSLRLYIRQVMLKSFSIDDAIILVALVSLMSKIHIP